MLKIVLKSIIKKYWKILLSTLIISALGCAIMTGLSSTQISLSNTVYKYIDEYDYPDAQISVNTTSEKEVLSKLSTIEGVEDVNTRICSGTIMISKSNEYYSTMIFSYDEKDFQKFHIWESVDESNEYGNISIEYNFAKDNNISVGDVVKFKIDNEYREFFISKIVSTPETMHMSGFNNSFIQMSNFGIVYVSRDVLKKETIKEKEVARIEVGNKENVLYEEENKAQEQYEKVNNQIINSTEKLKNEEQNLEKKYEEALGKIEELSLAKKELNNLKKDLQNKKSQLQQMMGTAKENKDKLLEAKDAINKIDLSLNQLKNNQTLLTSDMYSNIIKIFKQLPKDTPLELIYTIVNKIQTFLNYLKEYNIPFIIDGTVTNFADKLDSLMNQIIEENKYPVLVNYIKTENMFEITAQMRELHIENKFNDIQKNINEIQSLKKQVEERKNVKTVKELIDVYNEIINTLKNNIEELITKKQDIISQLAEQNILVEKLDETINNIDVQIEEGNEKIKEIEAGISEADSKIEQINNSIKEILNSINTGKTNINSASNNLNSQKNQLEKSRQNALNNFQNAKQEIEQLYEEIEDRTGYEEYYNQILLKFSKDANKDEVLKKCLNELQNIEVTDSFTYDNSELKQFLDEECIGAFETMAIFIPIIFFIVILIVVYLFISFMIQQSRKDIGILKAIGIETKTIRTAFSITTFLVSIGAVILGLFIGLGIMNYACVHCKESFPLPYFDYIFNYKMYIISVILTILMAQISTILAVLKIAKIEPVEIMTHTVQTKTKIPYILEKITSKLKPFTKFFIISFGRNTFKTLFSIVCIASTVVLIFTSMSFIASKNNILEEVYKKRINYNAQIFFSDKIDEELIKEMNSKSFISNVEVLPYYDVEILNINNGKAEQAIVNAKNQNSQFVHIYDTKENEIQVSDEGIVLERHLAESIGAKKGDIVNINNTPIVVTDISSQSTYRLQYVSYKQAEKLGTSNYETILLNLENNDKQKLLEYLADKEDYLYTIFTDDSYAKNEEDFKIYDVAVLVTVSFAIIIGLLIVINTTVINLQEAKKKLCMFKVIGFTQSEISRNMFGQSFIHLLFACVIGFPIGVSFTKVALYRLSVPSKEFVFVNKIEIYMVTALIVFAYVFLSHIIAMHTLKKWNIAENIKGRE